MKTITLIAILLVFASCKDVKKGEDISTEISTSEGMVHTGDDHPGKKLVETLCYACHNATTPEESRLAPPMIALKRRYLMDSNSKEEFINDISEWMKEPTLEKSKMYGAVDRFGVMPYLPTSEENVRLIAEYLYDYDIEQPEWFEEHFQNQQGQGRGMGRGNGMGRGMGMGRGDVQAILNSMEVDHGEVGLKYALSTKAQLGKNLIKAIEERGTTGAVEFCNYKAMKLTDSMSLTHNAIIKRVSDKPRNPKNLANKKESGHIATFKKQAESKVMDFDPIVEAINGEVNFYYPITTNALCLQCHGKPNEHIDSETLATLKSLYPKDKATGYDVGQIRGIWSIYFNSTSAQ